MPTYEYICENGHEYSEIRGMTEDQKISICAKPDCGTKLIRKFSAPPITFKGSGFSSKKG